MTLESDSLKAIVTASRIRNSNNAVTSSFYNVAELMFGYLPDDELLHRWQVLRYSRNFFRIFLVFWSALGVTFTLIAGLNCMSDTSKILPSAIACFIPLSIFAGMIYGYRLRYWNRNQRRDYDLILLLLKKRGYSYLTE
ncbi:MAG TPA: hypothetical protein VN081_04875 [Dongiaceae bacterium]|nr:hypothetical protein [Dongiaceae bacterium]